MSAFHQPATKLLGGQLLRPLLIVQQNAVQPSPQVPHTAAYAVPGLRMKCERVDRERRADDGGAGEERASARAAGVDPAPGDPVGEVAGLHVRRARTRGRCAVRRCGDGVRPRSVGQLGGGSSERAHAGGSSSAAEHAVRPAGDAAAAPRRWLAEHDVEAEGPAVLGEEPLAAGLAGDRPLQRRGLNIFGGGVGMPWLANRAGRRSRGRTRRGPRGRGRCPSGRPRRCRSRPGPRGGRSWPGGRPVRCISPGDRRSRRRRVAARRRRSTRPRGLAPAPGDPPLPARGQIGRDAVRRRASRGSCP